MSPASLHLLVTANLYELVASFQKPGLVLDLCAHSLAWGPAAVQTSHPSSPRLPATPGLGSAQPRSRRTEVTPKSWPHQRLDGTAGQAAAVPATSSGAETFALSMGTWIRGVQKGRRAAEVQGKRLPAAFSISTHICWPKLGGPVAWEGQPCGTRGLGDEPSPGTVHLGRNKPMHQYRLGLTCWRAALRRGTWVSWWTTR